MSFLRATVSAAYHATSMRQVATNIRTVRKAKGHTQESLARALNVAYRTVQGWEQGDSLPSRSNLEALAKEFDREPAFFYTNHDDEPVAA